MGGGNSLSTPTVRTTQWPSYGCGQNFNVFAAHGSARSSVARMHLWRFKLERWGDAVAPARDTATSAIACAYHSRKGARAQENFGDLTKFFARDHRTSFRVQGPRRAGSGRHPFSASAVCSVS